MSKLPTNGKIGNVRKTFPIFVAEALRLSIIFIDRTRVTNCTLKVFMNRGMLKIQYYYSDMVKILSEITNI